MMATVNFFLQNVSRKYAGMEAVILYSHIFSLASDKRKYVKEKIISIEIFLKERIFTSNLFPFIKQMKYFSRDYNLKTDSLI